MTAPTAHLGADDIVSAVLGTTALQRAKAATAPEPIGLVSAVLGLSVDVVGLPGAVGDLLEIQDGSTTVPVEVVAATNAPATRRTDGNGSSSRTSSTVLRCMPLGRVHGLRTGMPVHGTGRALTVPVGDGLLGRVLDGLGRPADGRGPLHAESWEPVDGRAPDALARARVDTPLSLGVRAMDTMTTVGRGQRIGLFAGSGVGKSSLLSMIARGTEAEVSVIALIGERGREVREFLEDDLGPAGLARSVVVVATSDEPPLVRLRAAFVATRIAEELRRQGRHAVLMMDSLTRVAMAQREIGLSVGEPPATRGYPPSTFSLLAQLLERAGTAERGSVTGIYTVLVDGDDHNEPIADAARSILDGHVVLTRDLATAGHFPSIDVLGSVSRVASRVNSPQQRAAATRLRQVLAERRRAQDLLDVGAYVAGTNPTVDAAVEHAEEIEKFLCQDLLEVVPATNSWNALDTLVTTLGGAR